MESLTPDARRAELARQHSEAQARRSGRSIRERARLKMLQWRARRFARKAEEFRDPPRRLLVIRPDHLGDMLFATPALHWLRGRYPQAHVTALIGPWAEAVLAGNPDVDEIMTLPFPGFTREPKEGALAPYALLQEQAQRLAAGRFDLALILRFDHWWGAWLAAAAGIPQRIGYDIDEVRPFLTHAEPYLRGRHEVVQNLGLVMAAAGVDRKTFAIGDQPMEDGWALRFGISAEDATAAEQLLAPVAGGRQIVAIHPGSGAAVKRWRPTAWADLARRLSVEHGVQVIFTGSAGEVDLIDPILDALRGAPSLPVQPVSLAGQTGLGVLAAVYRRCSVVIGPDSGPLHIAVAAGTPTVHLYGPVDRRTFGPWGSSQRHRVVTSDWGCIPCNRLDWPSSSLSEHGCVRDIALEQVLVEANTVLNAGGS